MKENLSYSDWKQLKTAKASGVQKIFLKNLYKIITRNLNSSSLTVTFLARSMAISKSTLNRKLLQLIGFSANELIRQCRLRKAVLFLSKGINISEAAYKTGFKTPSYFTQCFKKFYKITPKKYSKKNLFIHHRIDSLQIKKLAQNLYFLKQN
ncbi:MAG TPA: helix-turn-helix transcriptional regulator [Chitinophagaceae bacterium]|jgi:AraC-like DNA-binding protein